VFAVTSGKAGVGKTNVVANLAAALALMGKRVAAVDGNLGLARLNALLGVQPQHTLADFFAGQRTLAEVCVTSPLGIALLPSESGAPQVRTLSPEQKLLLLTELDALPSDTHVMLVDTASGVTDTATYFASAAHEIVLVVTPDPASLTEAHAMMNVLVSVHGERRFWVVVNMVEEEPEARKLFAALVRMSVPETPVSLALLGWIPSDSALTDAVRQQRTVLEIAPHSPSARAFIAIAQRMDDAMSAAIRVKKGLQFFFRGVLAASLEEKR
jgi:flagellar biosynthesis protein FlhG